MYEELDYVNARRNFPIFSLKIQGAPFECVHLILVQMPRCTSRPRLTRAILSKIYSISTCFPDVLNDIFVRVIPGQPWSESRLSNALYKVEAWMTHSSRPAYLESARYQTFIFVGE